MGTLWRVDAVAFPLLLVVLALAAGALLAAPLAPGLGMAVVAASWSDVGAVSLSTTKLLRLSLHLAATLASGAGACLLLRRRWQVTGRHGQTAGSFLAVIASLVWIDRTPRIRVDALRRTGTSQRPRWRLPACS